MLHTKQEKTLVGLFVLVCVAMFALGAWAMYATLAPELNVVQAAEPTVEYVQVVDVVRVPVYIDTCALPKVSEDSIPVRPITLIIKEEEQEKPATPPVTPPVVPPVEPPVTPPVVPPVEHPSNSNANCGVGNGIDANPPGCQNRNQDGEGTGPGHPGAQGGNGNAYGTTKPHTNNGKGKDK